MDNKENYKKAIDQIHASDDLKNRTLEKIENSNNVVKHNFIKYLAACAVFVVVFAVGAFYLKDGKMHENNNEQTQPQIAKTENDLPRFENIEQIREILEKNTQNTSYGIKMGTRRTRI